MPTIALILYILAAITAFIDANGTVSRLKLLSLSIVFIALGLAVSVFPAVHLH